MCQALAEAPCHKAKARLPLRESQAGKVPAEAVHLTHVLRPADTAQHTDGGDGRWVRRWGKVGRGTSSRPRQRHQSVRTRGTQGTPWVGGEVAGRSLWILAASERLLTKCQEARTESWQNRESRAGRSLIRGRLGTGTLTGQMNAEGSREFAGV